MDDYSRELENRLLKVHPPVPPRRTRRQVGYSLHALHTEPAAGSEYPLVAIERNLLAAATTWLQLHKWEVESVGIWRPGLPGGGDRRSMR